MTNKQLQELNADLQTVNNTLVREVMDAKKKNEELAGQVQRLQDERKSLLEKNVTMSNDLNEAWKKVNAVKPDNSLSEIRTLKEQVEKLRFRGEMDISYLKGLIEATRIQYDLPTKLVETIYKQLASAHVPGNEG